MPLRKSYARKSAKPYRRMPMATVKQVKSLIARNVDKEELRKTVAGGTVTTAGTLYSLLNTTDLDDSAKLDKLSLRFSITNVTNANQLVRVILFQYKQATAIASPTVGDILQDATPLGQFRQNIGQFIHLLSDKTYTMNLFNKSMVSVNIPYFKNLLTFKNDPVSGFDGNVVYALVIGSVNTNTTLSSIYVACKYHELG